MGAIAIAAAVVGIGMGIGGASMAASSAKKKRREFGKSLDRWLPDIDRYTDDYFSDLKKFTPDASKLADTVGMADLDRALAMREKAMPGIQKGTESAFAALLPLLRGELPPAVMQAFMQSGAASSVGSGFGGSGFGFVNQGLFGARGSLGAMQTGYGLLPALMSTLPQVNSPSTAAFLQSIMTPTQRTQTQLQVRGQNINIASTLAGMPTSKDVWGGFLQETGGTLLGAGMSGMTGGMGGSGGGALMGSSGSSISAPGPATIGNPGYITPL